MEDYAEAADHIIMTQKHLRNSVWKYFGFCTIDGKITVRRFADFVTSNCYWGALCYIVIFEFVQT